MFSLLKICPGIIIIDMSYHPTEAYSALGLLLVNYTHQKSKKKALHIPC